ncbi:MAG TPA: hypothetical protein VI299_20375 [Polyangiales bacterium]
MLGINRLWLYALSFAFVGCRDVPAHFLGSEDARAPSLDASLRSDDGPAQACESCAQSSLRDAGSARSQRPLLGSARGGHVWSTFCAQQPDAAPLPPDPRTLIQPGVNAGGAAYFNAFWIDCTDDEPTTCGEYRAGLARGKALMEGGRAWYYAGDQTDALLRIDADVYNDMWRDWGLSERPRDFDQLVAERWGIPLSRRRNPYPLPGEDPNLTDGGSGQLPEALTQFRDADGRYLGDVGFNCHECHTGKVGDPDEGEGLGMLYGSGNPLVDVSIGYSKYLTGLSSLIPYGTNKTRGTGDILAYPTILGTDFDRLPHYNESLVASPAAGSVDFPAWWQVGHRTRRFHDGSFAMDNVRPVLGFFFPVLTASKLLDLDHGRQWIEARAKDAQLWLESLTAPRYPGPIDSALAEVGAVLFHTKNLWAESLRNPTPRPAGGNGSCATCHGVYAPRYVHDPAFLERPELEGIAAYVVPIDLIDTDRARYASLSERLADSLSHTWWAQGTNEEASVCFGAVDRGGYLAPPLYGVWATAPYFHNGSVPNVWEVLAPAERKPLWRRLAAPPPAGAPPNVLMGFDTNLARAYDHERLGWRYAVLPCGEGPLDCGPAQAETNPIASALRNGPYGQVWLTWNLAPMPVDTETLETRKIYNTRKYSQGNGGHAFTAVLTDDERRALVEYLKTL